MKIKNIIIIFLITLILSSCGNVKRSWFYMEANNQYYFVKANVDTSSFIIESRAIYQIVSVDSQNIPPNTKIYKLKINP